MSVFGSLRLSYCPRVEEQLYGEWSYRFDYKQLSRIKLNCLQLKAV